MSIALTGCAFISRHQFTSPAKDWQTRSGQLLYRNAKTTFIGEVVVRSSSTGDFELTFSKGPGVNLFVIQQDAQFAQVKGALARMGWSGPVDHAPKQLRGWLGLREKVMAAQDRQSIRHTSGGETFLLRF
ncbi:MAG: hypothetical protein ABJB69_01705 [Spartobacteria bacterium]